MGLGILEAQTVSGAQVPGTVFLDAAELGSDAGEILKASTLKKGTGKASDIILVPQPSNSPNDPLNWPLWQRDLILLLYCYCCCLTIGGVTPVLGAITIPLLEEFNTDFTGVTMLTGYQQCAVGASAFFISALARKFGKRPLMIASMSSVLAGAAWASAAESYNSFVGARVVQGLGIAMFESVTYDIVGDMYHVHQRGTRMSYFIFAQSGMTMLPSVLAGKTAETLGWRGVWHVITGFLAAGVALCLLFGWETAFRRRDVLDLDADATDSVGLVNDEKAVDGKGAEVSLEVTESGERNVPREPFLQRLRLFHGSFTDDSVWVMVVRPFFVLLNATVVWTVIMTAFTSVWYIVTSFVIAQAFSGPPYSLTVAQQGYMSSGPWVGGILGCLFAGLICDPIARRMTKKNKGIYEPEFRLIVMAFVPIFSTIGYFAFGNLIAKGQSPVGASVVFGFCFVPLQLTGVSLGAYVVDAFRAESTEIFIITMAIKNFIFFGFTFVLNDWFANWGPAKMFNTIGGVQLAMAITTIPMYIYGKRLRAWWHAHDVLSRVKKAA